LSGIRVFVGNINHGLVKGLLSRRQCDYASFCYTGHTSSMAR
jgi:hypothetical protein